MRRWRRRGGGQAQVKCGNDTRCWRALARETPLIRTLRYRMGSRGGTSARACARVIESTNRFSSTSRHWPPHALLLALSGRRLEQPAVLVTVSTTGPPLTETAMGRTTALGEKWPSGTARSTVWPWYLSGWGCIMRKSSTSSLWLALLHAIRVPQGPTRSCHALRGRHTCRASG